VTSRFPSSAVLNGVCLRTLSLSCPQVFQVTHGRSGPERPHHQKWLKKESDQSRLVGIESKSVDSFEVLVDVAGKDGL